MLDHWNWQTSVINTICEVINVMQLYNKMFVPNFQMSRLDNIDLSKNLTCREDADEVERVTNSI